MKPIRHIISGNKLRLHLLFCLGILVLLSVGMYCLYISGFRFDSISSAFTECLLFLLCIYTGRWLCQAWYLKNKYALFILYSIGAFTALAVLKWLLVMYAFKHPYAGFMEVLRGDMPFLLSGQVLGMLLKMISASMQKELKDARIKAEQKESEFSLLQSQMSPHFLFNVLNNLYGISIEEHERIPQLLLKLSNLLRYSVYGATKPFVPLTEELEYIRNYIEFEQIRISDRLQLETDITTVNSPAVKIAPQVLIVFIENAFKHSKNTLSRQIKIDISLKITGDHICLQVINSYLKEKAGYDTLNESSGVGLANTLKRLELLYGNDYALKQEAGNDLYHVELRLKIKE